MTHSLRSDWASAWAALASVSKLHAAVAQDDRVGVEDELRDAVAVAQIDEDAPSVVAVVG